MGKRMMLVLSLVIVLVFSGCETEQPAGSQEIPEDFSFSIVWGVRDDSSYDSRTGKLVKDKYATHPEDYVAEYQLTDAERQLIYERIQALNLDSFRECYEPEGIMTKPPESIVLTARWNGREKTIQLTDIWGLTDEKNPDAEKILPVCNEIIHLLRATDAWKAMPDYETMYQ